MESPHTSKPDAEEFKENTAQNWDSNVRPADLRGRAEEGCAPEATEIQFNRIRGAFL
jgi:hypothetical protein